METAKIKENIIQAPDTAPQGNETAKYWPAYNTSSFAIRSTYTEK